MVFLVPTLCVGMHTFLTETAIGHLSLGSHATAWEPERLL